MRPHPLLACVIAASLAGCSRPEPVVGPKAPHGGVIAGLPGGLGDLEVVRAEVSGSPGQSRVFLYFLDPEGRPMTPAPTAATLRPKERGAPPVPFKPTGDADPSRAGALESPPLQAGDLSGELTSTVGGKPIALTIGIR